jgi:glycosyltransferase involved in cell wall biosynthesis
MTTFAVIIPVFNRPDALRDCVASVHRQELPALEIAVVDDHSTDDMEEVLEEIRTGGAMVFRNPENVGPSAARNLGAAKTTADWLVFLDADDELLPTALQTFSEAASEGCGLVRATWVPLDDREPGAAQPGFLSGTFAVIRTVFESAGCYDPVIQFGENAELLARLDAELVRARLTERHVELPTVRVHSPGGSRDYNRARVTSGIHILSKYETQLAASPKARAAEEAMVAVNAARIRDYGTARRYAWKALRSDPRNPRHVLRLAAVLSGPLASRYWSRNARPEGR